MQKVQRAGQLDLVGWPPETAMSTTDSLFHLRLADSDDAVCTPCGGVADHDLEEPDDASDSNLTQTLTNNWRTYAMKGQWYDSSRGWSLAPTPLTTSKMVGPAVSGRVRRKYMEFYHDKTSNPERSRTTLRRANL